MQAVFYVVSLFPPESQSHCGCAGLLAPFLAGAAVVIPAGGRFSAAAFWKDACKWGVTFYTAVPTIHQVCWAPLPTKLHRMGLCVVHKHANVPSTVLQCGVKHLKILEAW